MEGMSVTKAIEKARDDEMEAVSWSDEHRMYFTRYKKLKQSELKVVRIERALRLLGWEHGEAWSSASDIHLVGIPFREAVYMIVKGEV